MAGGHKKGQRQYIKGQQKRGRALAPYPHQSAAHDGDNSASSSRVVGQTQPGVEHYTDGQLGQRPITCTGVDKGVLGQEDHKGGHGHNQPLSARQHFPKDAPGQPDNPQRQHDRGKTSGV